MQEDEKFSTFLDEFAEQTYDRIQDMRDEYDRPGSTKAEMLEEIHDIAISLRDEVDTFVKEMESDNA